MKKKPTIRDVAKHAGVSPASVSYVINGVKKVSDETRLRVQDAIKELHYSPDFTAVSLSKRKSNLIGVLMPLIDDSPASVFKKNQYYHEFISGVELVAREKQYDTLITSVSDPEECRQWVKKRNLDGLVFLGHFPEDLYREMNKLSIPIVLIDTYKSFSESFHKVQINDEHGGYLATKHLIDLGHKEIAFVATELDISAVNNKRLEGYTRALEESGIRTDRKKVFECDEITFEQGFQMAEHLLSTNDSITGVVAASDILAIGMMKAYQENGKQVPGHYSIVGFDDISICKYMTPSLTTIRQDIFQKGKVATELLLQSIEADETTMEVKRRTFELPVQLIVRDSTKAL
ncbi:LacI family transcriptional regulator [Bacillus shivajii]|uniref:LacI family DNA-binding transcriptional regulator n=1 Tax=Bacillus shivajii TaxID=1983719 RepID=UPI001CFC11B3|nr:LacI family DNA-binding transcriptional regulator [Bacillus shivajii]UCZ53927.1 LacI family transcriptional regulator [Bacillus shivajii]